MSNHRALHVLIRIGDLATSGTVALHKEVLERQGSVWFAKFGKTVSTSTVSALNDQIKNAIPTFLYLVGKHGTLWFKCRLANVRQSAPEDASLIPAYYEKNYAAKHARLWFLATSLESVPADESSQLIVVSSARKATEVMPKSMASLFLVTPNASATRPE
jgi:hypothetical protein